MCLPPLLTTNAEIFLYIRYILQKRSIGRRLETHTHTQKSLPPARYSSSFYSEPVDCWQVFFFSFSLGDPYPGGKIKRTCFRKKKKGDALYGGGERHPRKMGDLLFFFLLPPHLVVFLCLRLDARDRKIEIHFLFF